jgi:putative transposase
MISRQSFFQSLRYEEMHLSNHETFDDVTRRRSHFIEDVHKKKRLHSAPGYLTPEQYQMAIHLSKTADRAPGNSR